MGKKGAQLRVCVTGASRRAERRDCHQPVPSVAQKSLLELASVWKPWKQLTASKALSGFRLPGRRALAQTALRASTCHSRAWPLEERQPHHHNTQPTLEPTPPSDKNAPSYIVLLKQRRLWEDSPQIPFFAADKLLCVTIPPGAGSRPRSCGCITE